MIIPDWLLAGEMKDASRNEKNLLFWLMTEATRLTEMSCELLPATVEEKLRMSKPDILFSLYGLANRIIAKPKKIEWYDVASSIREHDPWVEIHEHLCDSQPFNVEILVFQSETHWRYKTMVQRRLVCDGIIDRTIEKQNRESDELK